MGTKTISILDEAYNALSKEKENSESFSDVILRLSKERPKLSGSFGRWKISEKEVKEFNSELKKSWVGFGKK